MLKRAFGYFAKNAAFAFNYYHLPTFPSINRYLMRKKGLDKILEEVLP
jgi:hypothetical protein